jgi:hypothetical protein
MGSCCSSQIAAVRCLPQWNSGRSVAPLVGGRSALYVGTIASEDGEHRIQHPLLLRGREDRETEQAHRGEKEATQAAKQSHQSKMDLPLRKHKRDSRGKGRSAMEKQGTGRRAMKIDSPSCALSISALASAAWRGWLRVCVASADCCSETKTARTQEQCAMQRMGPAGGTDNWPALMSLL